MLNRTHVWFAAFVLIVFAGGIAAGVALDRSVWHGGRPAMSQGGFRGGDRGPGGSGRDGGPGRDGGRGSGRDGRGGDGPPTEAFVRDLDSMLTLSADQKVKVTAIIDAGRPQMKALQEETSKKFAAEQQSLHDQIVKVLTPEQAKKFEDTARGPFGFRWRGGGRGGR